MVIHLKFGEYKQLRRKTAQTFLMDGVKRKTISKMKNGIMNED